MSEPKPKEPFYFGKQGEAMGDVTRWLKDAFAALRGNLALILICCAIFGVCYAGARIADRLLPKKQTPQVGEISNTGAGKVEIVTIEKQKNGFLPWF